jgi:hypothetical protein
MVKGMDAQYKVEIGWMEDDEFVSYQTMLWDAFTDVAFDDTDPAIRITHLRVTNLKTHQVYVTPTVELEGKPSKAAYN